MSDDNGGNGGNAGGGTGNAGGGQGGQGGGQGGAQGGGKTFTQEQFNDLLAAERRKIEAATAAKFADYDDVKSKASQFDALSQASKSKEDQLNDRIAALEAQNKQVIEANAKTALDALRFRVAAKHGVKDEDVQFLTGTDEATLTAQGERFAALYAASAKKGNHSAREGNHVTPPNGETEEQAFARQLFGGAGGED